MLNAKKKMGYIIEWIFYVILCCVSVVFMYNVLQNYLEKETSFSVNTKPRTKLPTLTFCLLKNKLNLLQQNPQEYTYGLDFVIEYIFEYGHSDNTKNMKGILQEGDNFKDKFFQGKVNLWTLTTIDAIPCYRISASTDSISRSRKRILQVHFNTSIDLPALVIYITSEESSLGLPVWLFRDGQIATVNIEKHEFVSAFIEPIQTNFISEKSECRKESLMECSKNYLAVGLDTFHCPKKCAPFTTPSFPLCATDEEKSCALNVVMNLYKNFTDPTSNMCLKPCNTLHYNVNIERRLKFPTSLSNSTFIFSYQFSAPDVVTVYQEYLIYDTMSMVAYTGGILGMCIGFSFMNVITSIITHFQNMITTIKFKRTKQNLRPLSGIMKEDHGGTHFQYKTENAISLGKYLKDKEILEIKLKEQDEQMKRLQERLIILESKQENILNI